jgi:hypothetical protein
MAVTAACRRLELMRQTVAEDGSGGLRRHAPGLVVVIQSSDGHVQRVLAPPISPPMQIEHDPFEDSRQRLQ